ncbi:hypothetical protein E2C01_021739 [Portunus trituberculatus]|uniref:Uncharacterized protein n=1 Tax=Portunus trituberculatus TaxID=210409 RepID=A0A5B7E3D7_PORTR|nr:hypothetical protein [Portunus trituberculatus]
MAAQPESLPLPRWPGTVPLCACQASPSPFPLGCLAATLTVIPLPGRPRPPPAARRPSTLHLSFMRASVVRNTHSTPAAELLRPRSLVTVFIY